MNSTVQSRQVQRLEQLLHRVRSRRQRDASEPRTAKRHSSIEALRQTERDRPSAAAPVSPHRSSAPPPATPRRSSAPPPPPSRRPPSDAPADLQRLRLPTPAPSGPVFRITGRAEAPLAAATFGSVVERSLALRIRGN